MAVAGRFITKCEIVDGIVMIFGSGGDPVECLGRCTLEEMLIVFWPVEASKSSVSAAERIKV